MGGRGLSPKQNKLLLLLVIIVFKPKYLFLPSKPGFRACQVGPCLPIIHTSFAWGRLLWDFKFKYSHIHFTLEITLIKQIVSSFFLLPQCSQVRANQFTVHFFCVTVFLYAGEEMMQLSFLQPCAGVWLPLLNSSSESNFVQLQIRIKFQL